MNLPALRQMQRLALEQALASDYPHGLRGDPARKGSDFFGVLRGEVEFAAVAADAWADAASPLPGDGRLLESSFHALETCAAQIRDDGKVGDGDANSPYFALVPFTQALLSLRAGGADAGRLGPLVEAGARLFDAAATHIARLPEYLNPRGLEAVAALGLHRLTNEQRFLDRATACIEGLLAVQYPCGAQPYHTGGWIWGRRPAQVYQLLTVTMMLHVGRFLGWPEVEAYVRRLLEYELLSTSRRGEAFVSPFETLKKSATLACAGWQWPAATALGDAHLAPLAQATYKLWVASTRLTELQPSVASAWKHPAYTYIQGLANAAMLGVRALPAAPPFVPPQGVMALADISTVFVHEPAVDVCMTLLTGYSSFIEADCGNVKLFAVTPELTDQPTPVNAGSDALRLEWNKPTEQLQCSAAGGQATLRGQVFTKWDLPNGEPRDLAHLHARKMEVTMTWEQSELLLEFHTIENRQVAPVSSRLLFLLMVRPPEQAPLLEIGGHKIAAPPAADGQGFLAEAPLGVVSFRAADGSGIEITAELSSAQRILVQRPGPGEGTVGRRGPISPEQPGPALPANDGSLRLSFEGPDALEHGKYRIRFITG